MADYEVVLDQLAEYEKIADARGQEATGLSLMDIMGDLEGQDLAPLASLARERGLEMIACFFDEMHTKYGDPAED